MNRRPHKGSYVFGAFVFVVTWTGGVRGQDRMPPIPVEKMTVEQKTAIEEFKAARGVDLLGPFIPMLRSPEVMSRFSAVGEYLRFKSVLPPRLSEFVILLTARHWTQQYEWDTHYDIALKAGLKQDIATAIANGRRPTGMAEDEEILYDLCAELQHNQSVSDDTYNRALSKFGEHGIIDSVGIVAYYTSLAMFMNTARTPLPPGKALPLAPFPR